MNRFAGVCVLFCLTFSFASGEEAPSLDEATNLSKTGEHDKAAALLKKVTADEPKNAVAWYLLGRELFLTNKAADSVKAFDKYIKLKPAAASRQWERGISCYYAGQYKAGAKQFVDYQTYHAADVENAAWRFLCSAKVAGVETARKEILPIRGDRRVPMMEIYAMFKGDKEPKDVIAAANAGDVDENAKKGQRFYANLYVGLYEESQGNKAAAKKHLMIAAELSDPALPVNRYMWHVARIHCLNWKK